MSPVDALIDRLLQREGGYVNRPEDAGGPTNYGITQSTLNLWRQASGALWMDVAALTADEARTIYKARYLIAPGYAAIPDAALQEFLFDFAVNSGPGTATRALQTALKGMGANPGPIDGSLGPRTRAALAAVEKRLAELYYRVKCERYELLLRYVGRDHRQAIFAVGWANRLDELNDDEGGGNA
jgi:lysozyme family protein